MTAELAIRQPQTLSLPEKITYAQALADSNLLPAQYRKNPPNLLFAMEYAEALGVATIHALTSIHVIEGKPSASADLIASLVRRAGHRLRVSGDDTFALAQIIRADDPEFTFESRWDMNRARVAGLTGKGVWKSYPGAMLRARAITEVARSAAPDALFGVIYTPEELGAEVNADGDVLTAPSSRPAPAAAQEAPRSASDRLRAAVKPAAAPAPRPTVVPAAADEVVDAEVVEEPTVPLATRPQLTAINAALGALYGFSDRADKLAYLSGEFGREFGSSAELTKAEASQLIDKLNRAQAEEDAAAEALADAEPETAAAGAR